MICRPLPIPLSAVRSWISINLQGEEFIKYSLPPLENTLLVNLTSLNSVSNNLFELSNRSDTSAIAISSFLLLKITSPIELPRRELGLCSPRTHEIASAILLLPLPLGPTITLIPGSKNNWLLFLKDFKPRSVMFFKYKFDSQNIKL